MPKKKGEPVREEGFDYSKIPDGMFERFMDAEIEGMLVSEVLHLDGVSDAVREHLNNQVLDKCREEFLEDYADVVADICAWAEDADMIALFDDKLETTAIVSLHFTIDSQDTSLLVKGPTNRKKVEFGTWDLPVINHHNINGKATLTLDVKGKTYHFCRVFLEKSDNPVTVVSVGPEGIAYPGKCPSCQEKSIRSFNNSKEDVILYKCNSEYAPGRKEFVTKRC